MGLVKKIALLIMGIILLTITIISYYDKVTQEESDIVLEVARKMKKDNSGYLPLGEDTYADDAKIVEAALLNWNFVSGDGKKVAYLTFDDGPSTIVTEQVLDVLKKNEVKGTFFVLGSMIDKNQKTRDMLKLMVREGHAIGNHSYTHNYKILYPSGVTNKVEFIEDMNKSLNSMQAVLGADFYTRVMRFPGGHSAWDTAEIDEDLKKIIMLL